MKNEKVAYLTEVYGKEAGMTSRKIANKLKKAADKEEGQKNQKHVKDITITIEWRKSRTWGNCPRATAEVRFVDGYYKRSDSYYASGYGYDKESTVIAQVFNDYLRYKLWEMEDKETSKKPYGIQLNYNFSPYYEGGIGESCYRSISEYIGGTWERVASGRTFDVYKFTMKEDEE